MFIFRFVLLTCLLLNALSTSASERHYVDHVVVAINDLDKGMELLEEMTGVKPVYGGAHPNLGTHNALISLGDRSYLELLAPNPAVSREDIAPEMTLYIDAIEKIETLTPILWAVGTTDMAATRGALADAGIVLPEPNPGSRRKPDGSLLQWQGATLEKGQSAATPFFIEWGEGSSPALDSPHGCQLRELNLASADVDALQKLLDTLSLDITASAGPADAQGLELDCPNGPVSIGALAPENNVREEAVREMDVRNPQAVEAFIDGAVNSLMDKFYSPFGVVRVIKDGELILAKGYGYQDVDDKVPVDPDNTMYRPGSISKLFTWVSVLQLEEQGKLDLDTDVNEYLTQFQVEDSWPGQPVTLRHILTHTAGFEDGMFGYLIIDDPARIVPLAESLERYQPKRVNPPGQYVAYSNWGTNLAGLIVANLSGMNFNDYVQANIFDVLGMENATFVEPLPEKFEPLMAKRYGMQAGRYHEKPYEIIANFGPAGALAASASELEKFGRALLNGGEYKGRRILQPETVERFLDQQFSHDERTRGLGLGTIHYPYNGIDIVGHDGGTTTFISHLGLAPEEDLIFITSFSGPAAGRVHQNLIWPFYDQFFPPAEVQLDPPADFSERAPLYAGLYQWRRSSFTKVESLLRLVSGVEVTPTDRDTLMIAGREFVEEDTHLFREVDGQKRFAFQVDGSGKVTGMIDDGLAVNHYFRAPFYVGMGFIAPMGGLSLLVFLGVLLRFFYQRPVIRALTGPERQAVYASTGVAAANWLFVIFTALALALNLDSLIYEVPDLLKLALVFPVLAILGAFYHLYQSYRVWSGGLCHSTWARLRFSVVTIAALFMAWFYYYWNVTVFTV